jgi:hypothetical protein
MISVPDHEVMSRRFKKAIRFVVQGEGLLTPHTIQQALSVCATSFSTTG